MINEKFRIVITSASSEKAKSLRETLPASLFKKADVRFLDEEEVEGTLLEYDSGVELIKKMTLESFYQKDLAFFCGDSVKTRQTIETVISEYGSEAPVMLDLSCPADPENETVLLSGLPAEVDLKKEKTISLPNPLAAGLATMLEIINKLEKIISVRVSSQIPVSEFGKKGIEELQSQMVELINHGEIPEDSFGQQLIFNLIPGFGSNSAFSLSDYERSVIKQTKYLLANQNLDLSLSTSLSPIFFAFSLDVFVQFQSEIDLSRVIKLFENLDGFVVAKETPFPGPIQATKSHDFQITRIVETGNKNMLISFCFDNIYTSAVKPAMAIAAEIFRDHKLLK